MSEESKNLSDDAKEAAKKASEKASELKEEAKEAFEDAKEATKKAAGKAKEKASEFYEDAKEETKEFVEDAKETAKEFKEGAKDAIDNFSEIGGENKKLLAGILAILIGSLGIHKFILGYTKEGIIQIIISVVTCGIGGIIPFIEGIIYLTKSDAEFYQTYQVNKRPWF